MSVKYPKVVDAFKAIKVLWPDTRNITKHNYGNTLISDMNGWPYVIECKIDWPDGVTFWPPPEEKWRPAAMKDLIEQREARFSDYTIYEPLPRRERTLWSTGRIHGFRHSHEYPWMSSTGVWFKYCEVLDGPLHPPQSKS